MSNSVARKLARFKPGYLYVGMDLGLDNNIAKVMDERARVIGTVRFTHNQAGYAHLADRLTYYVRRHTASGVVVAMEPTNYFWMLVAAELDRRGIEYYLVNAYTVHQHRCGDNLDRSKDDPRDAFTVGDLLRTGKYTETRLLRGDYAELRQYAVLHERLQTDIGRQKTILRNTVGVVFPELTTVFKNLAGEAAMAMLWNHAAAAAIRQMTEDEFIAAVRADCQCRRLMVSKLAKAYKLAAVSVGLADGIEALQHSVRSTLKQLRLLETEAASVRALLIRTFKRLPESKPLLTLHGLGVVSAAIILAEIGNPQDYRHGAQLVKLAGTQPAPNTSGRKTYSPTPMSRQGRSRLRTVLYFACMRLVQIDPDFAQRYEQLQKRDKNPLTKKQALGALMNKLLRILWALMRHKGSYMSATQAA